MFRNLFALIGFAMVLFLIVGGFTGWYTYTREDGKLTLLIFTDKVEEGLSNFKNKAVKALTKPEDEGTKQKADALTNLFGPAAAPKAATPQPPSTQSTQLPASGR